MFAISMVIAAFFMIFAAKVPVARAMKLEGAGSYGGYDNQNPREQQARLTGWGKRALAAHQNAFEAFPAFAAAVGLCVATHADSHWVNLLAITHVASRAVYTVFYIANWDKARSTIWTLGVACTVGLMVLAAKAAA
jgi:uncharacterized MAPEG superfamily protein